MSKRISEQLLRTAGLVLVCSALAAGAAAETASSGGTGFTFKRVKVGERAPGARFITVQIDPEEQADILAANPAVPPPPETPFDPGPLPDDPAKGEVTPGDAPEGGYAWFWERISPNLAAGSTGRLEKAEQALTLGPDGATVRPPRLKTLQRIADAHGPEILGATAGRGVSPALALAVIAVESAGKPAAVSSAGATGLMQLMPATAERFGVSDRTDPRQNIRGGVAYLEWLLKEFEGDVMLALAGYNAGEGAVKRNGGVPPFAETRDYVPKVLAAWQSAKSLCLTPPQLISDGCVFRQGVELAQN
ncbi:MAG: lytic transglycosylase domain-containing protein [Pseudomonadota bacterium]